MSQSPVFLLVLFRTIVSLLTCKTLEVRLPTTYLTWNWNLQRGQYCSQWAYAWIHLLLQQLSSDVKINKKVTLKQILSINLQIKYYLKQSLYSYWSTLIDNPSNTKKYKNTYHLFYCFSSYHLSSVANSPLNSNSRIDIMLLAIVPRLRFPLTLSVLPLILIQRIVMV